MKFLYLTLLSLFSSIVYAQSIAEVNNNAKDQDVVTVTGQLTQQIKRDKFIIKDSTGEIKIEIEDYIWQQINSVKPEFDKTYTFTAKVDKKRKEYIELEATKIELAQ